MTKKEQILSGLHAKFGNSKFRYSDFVIQALLVNGVITDESEYSWKKHRGYYASAMSSWWTKGYMFKCNPRSKSSWVLITDYTEDKHMYRVQNCVL